MLPGFGFQEFLVLAVVALVVVGPRDLPRLAKTVGGFVRQARQMAREFQKSFDDMGRELELDELRKEVAALKRGEPFDDIKKEIKGVSDDMRSVDRDIRMAETTPSASARAASDAESAAVTAAAAGAATPSPSPGAREDASPAETPAAPSAAPKPESESPPAAQPASPSQPEIADAPEPAASRKTGG